MKKKNLLLVLFFPIVLFADYSWERSPAVHMVNDGIHALYNYEFESAISILDSAWKLDNTHPLIPFVLISAKWLKTQTQEGYTASYDMINYEVKKTVPIYTDLLEKYPDDPEVYLYLGSTYGIRARTAMASKEWLNVLFYGYKGLKYVRKAHNMDKNLIDVYMPIGLMEYFSCLSPAPVRWAAKITGLTTDCDVGLQYLNLAALEAQYSWIEASNVLSYAYLHILRDYGQCRKIIEPLTEQFFGHPFFAFMRAELLAKTGRWDELQVMIPRLEKFAMSGPFLQRNECQLKLAYLRGLKAFYHGNYSESLEKTNWVLENYHMEFDWLRGFSYLLQGQSYDMLGERHLAKRAYKQVLKMDNYYPEVVEAKTYLDHPFSIQN